jgi:outer membrane protein TolC
MVWAFIFFAQPATAQTPAGVLSLTDLIREAKDNNPAIRAIREKWLASRQDIAVRTWWDQPVIGGDYWLKNGSTMVELSQTIPFPVKTVLEWQAATAEAEASKAELDLRTSTVIDAVKKAYYMYYFAGRKAENARENLALMKDIAASAEALYASGRVPQSDILSADAEAARMQNMLLMLDAEKESAREELAALLGRGDPTTIGEPGFDLENLPESAGPFTNISSTPEIRMLASMARSKRIGRNRAGWEWFPDLMLGVRYDSMLGTGLTAGLSFPLYIPKRFAEMNKARHETLSADAMLADAANMARSGLTGLAMRYQAAAMTCRNYRTVILPLSRQALILDQTSYAAGKTGFVALLEASRRYLSDRNEYLDTLAETWTILADIDALRGAE